tara:strand:+ start:279 stop:1364 length:1086 start_codon:yes stop_codon:yes gene_type:complete
MVPLHYWIKMRNEIHEEGFEKYQEEGNLKIHIILPMRNEITNVVRKISSIVSEIEPYQSATLTVADSNSYDGTRLAAEDFLRASNLSKERWEVRNFEILGKNVALNRVIEKNEADIFVMSDADAYVSPGWLRILLSRFSDEEVGVVSGIEIEDDGGSNFNSLYRRSSNWLRIMESRLDSTPVLEGSILAWRSESMGSFRFDERVNADDAQIGMHSIKSGYRSIVDPRITFEDFDNNKRTFRESVRRAQGLSITLIRNSNLSIIRGRRFARRSIFNAIALYIFFPWFALIFGLNALIAFSDDPVIGHSWEFYSVASILVVCLAPQGRSLILGSVISIVAHLQAMVGIRYNNWNPTRSSNYRN